MSTNPQQLRQHTVSVNVGGVIVGGGAPIVVQSMTNTDTADVEQTARQVAALARAGSELVRVTVDRDQAAAAVPQIKERLGQLGVSVPIVGDFHYIGHKLLADHPACAEALDKYRINPGNVGFRNKRDLQFSQIVEMALKYNTAAAFWAATTLLIKVSPLVRTSAEKIMLYQLVVSAPVMAAAALFAGEHMAQAPSTLALGALAYQTIWVVSVTFVVWFALIARYSANRLSAFTFLTPLFGVAAGHLVLREPLTWAFAAAVMLVAAGLALVNRTR